MEKINDQAELLYKDIQHPKAFKHPSSTTKNVQNKVALEIKIIMFRTRLLIKYYNIFVYSYIYTSLFMFLASSHFPRSVGIIPQSGSIFPLLWRQSCQSPSRDSQLSCDVTLPHMTSSLQVKPSKKPSTYTEMYMARQRQTDKLNRKKCENISKQRTENENKLRQFLSPDLRHHIGQLGLVLHRFRFCFGLFVLIVFFLGVLNIFFDCLTVESFCLFEKFL